MGQAQLSRMWSEVVERDGEGDQSVRVIADDLLLAGSC